WNFQAAQDLSNNGGSIVFTNQAGGLVTKSGANTSAGNAGFNNDGSVQVNAGTLNLAGGGTDTGAFTGNAGLLNFGGGTHSLTAASSIIAAGTVGFSAGTANLAGGYALTGQTLINGGAANFN